MAISTVSRELKETHGNKSASSFRADAATESQGKSVALECLNREIDAFGMPRKALADELGTTAVTLSKMTTGLQAFGLDAFERLPRDLQIAFLIRYGRDVLGLHVQEILPTELMGQFVELVDQLATVARLTRLVGKPRQVKACLSAEDAEERVG